MSHQCWQRGGGVDEVRSNNDALATDFADAVQDTVWEWLNKAVRTWGAEHQAEIIARATSDEKCPRA